MRELIAANKKAPGLYAFAGEILVMMDQTEPAREYFDRYDELKYDEKDGAKPIRSHTSPNRGAWKEYFY